MNTRALAIMSAMLSAGATLLLVNLTVYIARAVC